MHSLFFLRVLCLRETGITDNMPADLRIVCSVCIKKTGRNKTITNTQSPSQRELENRGSVGQVRIHFMWTRTMS